MKTAAIALNTFREAIRHKILYTVLLFAALLVGISAFFGAVSIGSQVKVIKDFGLFSLSFFGAVLTILSGVNLLNKELKQKTVYNILSKPVARWEFILGKYFGLTLSIGALVALMGAALVGFVALFENRIDWLLFQGILLTLLEMCVIAAVTIFFSSLVVTVTLTGIFTLAAYIAGRSIDYLSFFVGEDPATNPFVTKLVYVVERILPDLNVFNAADLIVYGNAASAAFLFHAVLYCLAYSAALLVLAVIIFERRELT